jgi:leader peptidase (prepilin peptidase)/N-methyltransferase
MIFRMFLNSLSRVRSQVMVSVFEQIPPSLLAVALGCLAGLATWLGTVRALRDLGLPLAHWPRWFGLTGALLGGLFVWAALEWQFVSTPEVIPAGSWGYWRVVYHLSLIVLLLIITATDLRCYYILDWCSWLGIGIAVAGAVASGHFQLAHVWVDWNAEIPQLQGPWIPEWLKFHPHLHGLAWSLAGMGMGACGMWLIRWLSSRVLGLNAMGAGDVLLMAMIGAYLGWQPTIFVLLLSPILALVLGGLARLRFPAAILPYGPFLALAAIVILFSWRFIWMAEFSFSAHGGHERETTFAVRRLFGDPVAMAIMAGLSFTLLLALLGLLRLYKTLPVSSTGQDD